MTKYGELLLQDLPQQFRGKEKIEALLEVIGNQMDEVLEFYESLNLERSLRTAKGETLDKIGEILVLSRSDARKMFNKTEAVDDDLYRRMLIYKTIMNFGSATYYDIMNCIKVIQGDNGFRYKEELTLPATIVLESDEPAASKNVQEMLKTPIPKAAGVGLRIRANDGASFGYGIAFTSQVLITKELSECDELDVDESFVCCIDESENMLTAENGDIILTEESV